jgi:hypothetical protein
LKKKEKKAELLDRQLSPYQELLCKLETKRQTPRRQKNTKKQSHQVRYQSSCDTQPLVVFFLVLHRGVKTRECSRELLGSRVCNLRTYSFATTSEQIKANSSPQFRKLVIVRQKSEGGGHL